MPCQGPYGASSYGPDHYHNYLEAERQLCEARWLLLRLTELQAAPANLRTLIAKHTAAQLKHRQGDKEHVLVKIEQTLCRLADDEKEIERRGGQVAAKLTTQRQKLVEARDRIARLSDDDLLAEYWGTETRLTADVVDH